MGEATEFRKSRSGYKQLAVVSALPEDTSESKSGSVGWLPQLVRQKTKRDTSAAEKKTTGTTAPHPIFSLPDARRSKKAMKKPEFLRYMQYVKEGGTWDPDASSPSIYFK